MAKGYDPWEMKIEGARFTADPILINYYLGCDIFGSRLEGDWRRPGELKMVDT